MNSRFGKIRLALALVAILACLLAQAGWATTYYVATPANGGSDTTGDGSISAPWASIDKADTLKDGGGVLPLLKPGDTVVVTEGLYLLKSPDATGTVPAVNITLSSGEAGNPITYIAQGNVTIDGQGSSGSGYPVVQLGSGIDYIVFDGFDIKGGRRALNLTGTTANFCEGNVVRNCKIHEMHGGFAVQNAHIHNCKFYNNVIYTYSAATTEGTQRGFSTTTAYGNKFWNNTIYISGAVAVPNSPWVGGIYFGGVSTTANPAERGTDECRNNIIWPTQTAGNVVGLYAYTATQLDPVGDPGWYGINIAHSNNLCWPAGPRFIWIFRYPDPAYIGNWQDVSLYDIGIPNTYIEWYADPLFVNAAGGDFRLQATSPAIDAGVDVGLPYLGLAPDLGAIESLPPAFSSIADALAQAEGSVVTLTSAVVTVASGVLNGNVIYVEDESRASGVAVQSKLSLLAVAEGERVEITGQVLKTGLPQPIISAFSIRFLSGGTPLKPLGTPNKSAIGLTGLDNTGLLVTIWGKVNAVSSDYFCVDDGSGRDDATGTDGIPVFISDQVTPLTTPTATYVAVTGVLGKVDVGDGAWVAVIRPRVQADIKSYAP